MYDPLVDPAPPALQQKPESFWADAYSPALYSSLNQDVETEIAIVGGGYTGLSAAYHLRTLYGIDCCVIEANQPGWGCSGRNGGFVLPGTGRLGMQQIAAKWSDAVSSAVFKEYQCSIQTVDDFISKGIECDKTPGGYLKLAHHPKQLPALHAQASAMSEQYGENIQALSAKQITDDYLAGTQNFGGVFYPNAYSVNPWRLAQGLARLAFESGAQIYANSPVIEASIEPTYAKANTNAKHNLQTPRARVTANTLIIASNAYGQRKLFPTLQDRTFPVISSIIVTAPLSDEQLANIGMKPGLMVMDTRPLKYYYRILPDNRLLFGGRGALRGKHAGAERYKQALQKGLIDTFPQLKNLAVEHFWSGWVAVSFDDYPRVFHDQDQSILYSAGYCGAGLAFSIQAGKRLAQLYAEPDALPDLPYWKTPLKRFPLASLRRPALQGFYWWEALKRKIGV